MKFHDLELRAKKTTKRVGRGIGSGHGKTAGRGTKGQNARTGGGVRVGFEGGQNPLLQRIPKQRGFKSMSPKAQVVHTDQLGHFKAGSEVTTEALFRAGLINDPKLPVKILGRGKPSVTGLTLGKNVTASASAKKALVKPSANAKATARSTKG